MEIERKFWIKKMPNLSSLTPIRYERYYLKTGAIEERIQKRGEKYEHETKKRISDLERTKDKKEISKEEFDNLKQKAGKVIIRDSYKLDDSTSIKIYHGEYEGLFRAEVEFNSKKEAVNYQPEDWMGKEITDTPLGKDSLLIGLSQSDFKNLLKDI